MRWISLALLVLFSLVEVDAGIKEDHEVKKLPLLDFTLNFKHYSGYLNVSETKFLHYW